MSGLLDTSVFIARERERPIEHVPDDVAISVVTVAELHLGVLLAADAADRQTRLRTLVEVERDFEPIPVDGAVARSFAELVANARSARRRIPVMDAWIAATALAHGLDLYTQDTDFTHIPGLRTVMV